MSAIVQFKDGTRAKTTDDGWVYEDKRLEAILNEHFTLEALTGAEPNIDNAKAREVAEAWGGRVVQFSPTEEGDADLPKRERER